MDGLVLKGLKVIETSYANRFQEPDLRIDLEIKINSHVKTNQEEKKCLTQIDILIEDSNKCPEFRIFVSVLGRFLYDGTENKEELHKATVNALYPHARVLVANLTASAFAPTIHLPVTVPFERIEVSEAEQDK